jgi:hypothetical protein
MCDRFSKMFVNHKHKKSFGNAPLNEEAKQNREDNVVCVCVLTSGYNWGTVMHEIPISSFPILMTSLPYPRTQ